MDQAQYQLYRERILDRKAIQHEGRSASTIEELDWMAREVYGLNPDGEPVAKQAEVKSSSSGAPAKSTGSASAAKKATPARKPRNRGRKVEAVIVGNQDILKMSLEDLTAKAKELGIEADGATRGQLIDKIVAKQAEVS